MDLFREDRAGTELESKEVYRPLAVRMRPESLDEIVGQDHLISKGKLLRKMIEGGTLQSMILYGPPSSGKTTLAMVIARNWKARFITLNAVLDGVKELKSVIKQAEDAEKMGQRTIVFVDEIHRWNRAQQDALLPHVELGQITLIGATTENPFYALVGPLLSRCQLFELYPPDLSSIMAVIDRSLSDKQRGLGQLNIEVEEAVKEYFARHCGGDIRFALNALESSVKASDMDEEGVILLTQVTAEEAMSHRKMRFNKTGDEHYHYASAFIKSMRGSDPDAALYWLSAMVESGEDPRFVFRRMLIFCSEDIGMADSNALRTVLAAQQAYEVTGMPEGWYFLSHACLYCSLAPKSNSTSAVFAARDEISRKGVKAVPEAIRDKTANKLKATYTGEKDFSEEYKYPHDYPGHWVQQQYLPDEVKGKFYNAGDQGAEPKFVSHLRQIKTDKS